MQLLPRFVSLALSASTTARVELLYWVKHSLLVLSSVRFQLAAEAARLSVMKNKTLTRLDQVSLVLPVEPATV